MGRHAAGTPAVLTLGQVLRELRSRARPEQLAGMARYGLSPAGRLGVSVPEMRLLARRIGRDHRLALRLWRTGIQEARIVASLVADPAAMTAAEMDRWVGDLDSWDVCDQACMNLFGRTPHAWAKVQLWTRRRGEYVKRAGFVLLARLAQTDRSASDETFLALLPEIVRGATDGRNYVKKAVSWALRRIGRRNTRLNAAAVRTARELRRIDSSPARWVGADALRELTPGRRTK